MLEYNYGFETLPSNVWLFLINCGEELGKALKQHFESLEVDDDLES